MNGDGYDDVVVGNQWGGGSNHGLASVFLGSAAGLGAEAAWTEGGDLAGALLGYSVASAGDVDGDGRDEIVEGAPGYDDGGTHHGAAYLYTAAGPGPAGGWRGRVWMRGHGPGAGRGAGRVVRPCGGVAARPCVRRLTGAAAVRVVRRVHEGRTVGVAVAVAVREARSPPSQSESSPSAAASGAPG